MNLYINAPTTKYANFGSLYFPVYTCMETNKRFVNAYFDNKYIMFTYKKLATNVLHQ